MNEGDIEQMEAQHHANVEQARELLVIIKTVGERQQYWKELLEHVYETEAIQEEQSRELSKEVLLQEAESLANSAFVSWLGERNHQRQSCDATGTDIVGSARGVGREGLHDWFHSDELALETPFAAMIPFPRHLSDDGLRFFSESVDELLFSPNNSAGCTEAYVYTVLANQPHQHLTALLNIDATPPPEKSSQPTTALCAPYCKLPCRSGEAVLRLIMENRPLKEALAHHPCVFLTTKPLHAQCIAKVAVIGGVLIAMQLDQPFAVVGAPTEDGGGDGGLGQPSGANGGSSLFGPAAMSELSTFIQELTASALPGRSYYAIVGALPSAQRKGGYRWALLGIDSLSGQELECFGERELFMIARVLVPLYGKLTSLVRAADPSSSSSCARRCVVSTWSGVCRRFHRSAAVDAAVRDDDPDMAHLAQEIKAVIEQCRRVPVTTTTNTPRPESSVIAVDAATDATAHLIKALEDDQRLNVVAPRGTVDGQTPPPLAHPEGTRDGRHSNAMLVATVVSTVAATLGVVALAGKFLRSSK